MRKQAVSLVPTGVFIFCPDGRLFCKKIPKDGTTDGRYYLNPVHIVYIDKDAEGQEAKEEVLKELNVTYGNIYPNNNSYILHKITGFYKPIGKELYYLKFKEKMALEIVGNINVSLIDFNKLAERVKDNCKNGALKKVIYNHCEVDNIMETLYLVRNLKRGSNGT